MVLVLGGSTSLAVLRRAVHAVEDPKSSNNFGVLSVVQNFELYTNRVSINSFGVKLISQRLKRKVTERSEGRRVCVPGLRKFIATADSEASDAESPHFEGDAGAEVPADAPGVVGTTLMEHVEVEEMQEEDPDVHFKRKR